MGWTKEKWDKEIPAIRDLYRKDPLNLYSKDFYCRRIKWRGWEMDSGKIISDSLNIKSMVDFGCGLGSYLEGALEAKTEKVLGFDIGADLARECIPENISDFIRVGNVGKEINCGKWDCAFSIETAEHLLPEEEDAFVTNLFRASSRLIVFTAAYSFSRPHLNAGKTPYYWEKKFLDLGCVKLKNEEDALKKLLIGSCKKHIIKKLTVLSIGKDIL